MKGHLILCNNRFYLEDKNTKNVYREVVFSNKHIEGYAIDLCDDWRMELGWPWTFEKILDTAGNEYILYIDEDGQFGMGKRGEEILTIPRKYEEIKPYKWGIITLREDGNLIVGLLSASGFQPLEGYFDEIIALKDRYLWDSSILLRRGNKHILCTLQNEELYISSEYDIIDDFMYAKTLLSVHENNDGETFEGLIDRYGKVVVDCKCLSIEPLSDDNLLFFIQNADKRYYIYDALNHKTLVDNIDGGYWSGDVDFVIGKDGMQGIVNCKAAEVYPLFNLPYNYELDLSTLSHGFVVVHDFANNKHVCVLNYDKAIKGDIQIFTQDNWDSIDEGFSRAFAFDGEPEPLKIKVLLSTGEFAYYDENFNELYRESVNNASDQQDSDDVDDEAFIGFGERDEREDSPLDAFEGDETLYNEWRLNS